MALRKNTYVDFRRCQPIGATAALCADPVNTTQVVNYWSCGDVVFESYSAGTNSDIRPLPVVDTNSTTGWQIPNDATDDDGIEMALGILADANMPYAFKVGTDPAFRVDLKFGIPVVADYDIAHVGFRKAAAFSDLDDENADFGTAVVYTDFAVIGVDNGAIKTSGAVNQTGGGTGTATITDSTLTWANDAVKTLSVLVSAAGVVSYEVDGTAVATATATTFDDTDIVIPFFAFCKDANGTDSPPILETFFCGYQ